uniref:RNA replicase n=1 Tax=Hubei noda-like virus 19 TaxID=1922974 RepID=A0A1L3KGH3_9VIRU|nr:hypothetical protein 1 [Hubei noda-like virus 19]
MSPPTCWDVAYYLSNVDSIMVNGPSLIYEAKCPVIPYLLPDGSLDPSTKTQFELSAGGSIVETFAVAPSNGISIVDNHFGVAKMPYWTSGNKRPLVKAKLPQVKWTPGDEPHFSNVCSGLLVLSLSPVLVVAHGGAHFARLTRRLYKHGARDLFTFIIGVIRTVRYDKGGSRSTARDCARDYKPARPVINRSTGHSHPEAAGYRHAEVTNIRDHLSRYGYPRSKQYDPSVGGSKRDEGVNGHRHVLGTNDLAGPLRYSVEIPSDVFVTLIDQDYYFESLNQFAGRPIVIYTMLVDGVSGFGHDSDWYFESPQVVCERVTGGKTYRQCVFDYGKDQVAIRHDTFVPRVTIYDVHAVPDALRKKQIVFLTPAVTLLGKIETIQWLALSLNGIPLGIEELTKLGNVVQHGNFIAGKFVTPRGVEVCIKRVSDVSGSSSVSIGESQYNALKFVGKDGGGDKTWNTSACQRYINNLIEGKMAYDKIVMLAEYFDAPIADPFGPNIVILPSQPGVIEDTRHKGEKAMEPIVDQPGGVIAGNDAAVDNYVEERMLPNVNTTVPPGKYASYASEFVRQVVRNPGRAAVASLESVIEEQNGPLQKARAKKEKHHVPETNPIVRGSLKSEVVAAPAPARCISTVATSHTQRTGMFDRGFKKVIPRTKGENRWVVGFAPKATANVIRNLADEAVRKETLIAETDFSKMDETISRWLRVEIFEASIRRAYVNTNWQEELEEVLSADTDRDCRLGKQRWVEGGSKNYSGSGFTTTINTLVNMFVKYCICRENGLSVATSYEGIGPCYGDDGLMTCPVKVSPGTSGAAEFSALVVRVGSDLGLKLKVELQDPHEELFFLGRLYPHVLESLVSMARPSRTLPRVCVCVGPAVLKRADRLRGYWTTEYHVPVVSEYLQACSRVYKIDLTVAVDRAKDRNLWYRSQEGTVPALPTDREMLNASVCKDLDITPSELQQVVAKLKAVKTLSDLENIKLHIKSEMKLDESKFYRC